MYSTKKMLYVVLLVLFTTLDSLQALEITNGPMDTTVHNGSIANISCGFVNANPNSAIPDWRIVMRSDNGSVISNMTVRGSNIIRNNNDGLEWVADTTSGVNMSPKSRLVVGPVDETYNQSSYQCIFILLSGDVESSIGTLTVAGIPKIVPDVTFVWNFNEGIVTLILRWGEPFNNLDPIVNYTVSCSGDVTCPLNFTTTDNTTISYTVTNLTPMTTYTFSIIATNSIGSGEPSVTIITTPGTPALVPNVTVDVITINSNGNNITVMLNWGEPFNNLDPIVNYTVSCSGNATWSPNFTTTDNTTRSYTITNLTPNTTYTFSVVATNSIGSGVAHILNYTTQSLQIINGPRITSSVCNNGKANIFCGFQGANPASVEVIWYISRNNGSAMTVNGRDIISPTYRLQWALDPDESNEDDSRFSNSKLIVSPVGEEDDQSTYQCSIGLLGEPKINSTIETLTVIGPPAAPINLSVNCTAPNVCDCMISWNATDDSICGIVTYHIKLEPTANKSVVTEFTTMKKIYMFTNSPQYGNYSIFVYGTNEAGDGQTGNSSSILPNRCGVSIPYNNVPYKDDERNNNSGIIVSIILGIITVATVILAIILSIWLLAKKREYVCCERIFSTESSNQSWNLTT